MKANIKDLVQKNPSGLLEIRPSLTIPEYRDNFGFGLKATFPIYESKRSHSSGEDWFAFAIKTLDKLFHVSEESNGDLLVVYIIETIKNDKVYCNLLLTQKAYREILNDETQHVLQIHQVYSEFWRSILLI